MTTIKYKMGGAWFDLLPNPLPGFIYPFGGGTVPQGFLLCNGQAVSRTTYAELFAVIGTVYGGGDGSTTFNVPDLRGRVGIGASSGHALGSTGGSETVTLITDQIPSHTHSFVAYGRVFSGQEGSGFIGGTNPAYGSDTNGSGTYVVNATGGGQAHNNMQPYNTINYIISTGQNTSVSVEDIITGVTTLPLKVQYGGTGATNAQQFGLNFGLAFYPVGSIFCSVNNTSPSQLFGGTWAALESRMLIGAGSGYAVNATGGETSHTLSVNEMPSHNHGQRDLTGYFKIRSRSGAGYDAVLGAGGVIGWENVLWSGSHAALQNTNIDPCYYNQVNLNVTHTHDANGGGAAHNNMPPYLAVYMWKRTA